MIRMLKIAIDAGHGLNTAGKEVPAYMGYGKIKSGLSMIKSQGPS